MYYKINESLSKEENIKLATEYSAKAKQLLNNIDEAVKEGFKFVPRYGTKSQNIKFAMASEVIDRLQSAAWCVNSIKSSYDQRERMAKEAEEKKAREEAQKKYEAQKNELLNEAIAYLIEKGLSIGKDFLVENAIEKANDIAFELECNRKESEGGYVGFSGQNCEDECAGWNPSDRRCECGNRRVSWTEGYSHSFKTPDVYAEAY